MFKISTRKVSTLGHFDNEDASVSESIYTLYCNDNHFKILINWNGFLLPMNGSTLSQIYNDIILMIELIKSNEKKFTINFLDNCFTAIWHFTITDYQLKIKSNWINIASFGDANVSLENLNKVSKTLSIQIDDFINEWNSLLKIVKNDLINSGYNENLDGFEYLNSLD